MDPREQRGIIIAAMCRIDRQNGAWIVPSQSAPERKYTVKLEGNGYCTCPDCAEGGFTCKHIRAVRITLKRELGMDGTVTETKSITLEEKKSYPQVWRAYNLAQSTEKKRLQVLLQDLCRYITDPEHNKTGPKPHRRRDMILAMCLKVYCGLSTRRSSCDLADAHEAGYLTRPIPGMKVAQFMENPALTPILFDLIVKSAAPLRAVETGFAVDSSGFSSSRFERWYDHKYGCERRKSTWVKVHVACGVKTNVITAVRILDKDAADCPQFAPLMKTTAQSFTVGEVSADKAYLSAENIEQVFEQGGTPYILPKSNTTGSIGGLFEQMVRYFQCRQEDFLSHYHKRSNVESTFSAVKRKFGDSVMSKSDVAMVNEVLCKLLCHNLCCLIQEQCELGIEPVFWPDEVEEAVIDLPTDMPAVAPLPAPSVNGTPKARTIGECCGA
jgi:transposase